MARCKCGMTPQEHAEPCLTAAELALFAEDIRLPPEAIEVSEAVVLDLGPQQGRPIRTLEPRG